MLIDNRKCDVVIVGGGPGGSWVADQLKIRKPDLNIVVLEKREHYLRTHPVKLESPALSGTPDHPRLNQIISKFKEKKICRINDVEHELKTLGRELGIDYRIQEVVNPEQLSQTFPNAKIFIGADGAHSIVRKKIFKDNLRFNKFLQHIVEVKYDVWGRARSLSPVIDFLPMQKTVGTLVNENISSERNGKSSVTLQFFVDKQTHEKMKAASFARPYHLATDQHLIPPELLTAINTWLRKRRDTLGEQRVDGTEKLTAILLKNYSTKAFVKEGKKPGTTWCLVGDAAFGIPFFRSLNTCFLSGTELSKAIVASFDPPNFWKHKLVIPLQRCFAGDSVEGNIHDALISYAAYIRALSYLEALMAKIKSIGVDIFRALMKFPNLPKLPAETEKSHALKRFPQKDCAPLPA